jgi:hypothetical protein
MANVMYFQSELDFTAELELTLSSGFGSDFELKPLLIQSDIYELESQPLYVARFKSVT